MILDFYQNIPLFINPIAFSIGSFAVRWYSLMFSLGFLVALLLLFWRISKKEGSFLKMSIKEQYDVIFDLVLLLFFASLIGGRFGFVLFYDSGYFFAHPLEIFWPFSSQGGFTGFFGMSYHGALVGILIAGYIFAKKKKISFLALADFVVPAGAVGYFFGRIGNFLNGELFGRITSSPLGMRFYLDQDHLRYPSQLFEAFLEGLVVSLILWKMRNKKGTHGFVFFAYIMLYSLARFVAEFFREPDQQVGFVLGFLTMGQILSGATVIGALIFWKIFLKRNEAVV